MTFLPVPLCTVCVFLHKIREPSYIIYYNLCPKTSYVRDLCFCFLLHILLFNKRTNSFPCREIHGLYTKLFSGTFCFGQATCRRKKKYKSCICGFVCFFAVCCNVQKRILAFLPSWGDVGCEGGSQAMALVCGQPIWLIMLLI